MTEPFAKLLASITDSSIWDEDNETRIVWVTLLAMADADGYVGAAVTGIAHRARVPLAATEKALARFMAPDKYSRDPSHEGRRLEKVNGGWRLLNYAKVRNNMTEQTAREYEAQRKRAYRERKKMSGTVPGPSASVSNSVSASKVTREDVAAVYREVTGKTDLPEMGVNWAGRKADAGDTMRAWANGNGGLAALRAQLEGLAQDDFMAKQAVHVWADRVGTIVTNGGRLELGEWRRRIGILRTDTQQDGPTDKHRAEWRELQARAPLGKTMPEDLGVLS